MHYESYLSGLNNKLYIYDVVESEGSCLIYISLQFL
jgi:hypothetical protein